jgi:hypothetical protein
MAFQDVSIKLNEIANKLDQVMPDIIAVQVMNELMAMHKKRIFDDGLNTDGAKLGEYSTTEKYFAKDKFIRKSAFKGVGKPNKEGKRKANTTMFLAKGYSEFRDIQGRKTDHINLKFSGSLEGNIFPLKEGNAVLYGTTDVNESIKFDGLEDRFEVFGLSIQETEFLKNEITEQAILVAGKK